MEIAEVHEIYSQMMNSSHPLLAKSLINNAVRYSRLRVDWFLADLSGRLEMEMERTAAHNAFISACDILSRNMQKSGEDNSWRLRIGSDRKEIGDFACLLHAVMGIKAR